MRLIFNVKVTQSGRCRFTLASIFRLRLHVRTHTMRVMLLMHTKSMVCLRVRIHDMRLC